MSSALLQVNSLSETGIPSPSRALVNSAHVSGELFHITSPLPCAKKASFLFATFFGSKLFNVPEVAFRAFAKSCSPSIAR